MNRVIPLAITAVLVVGACAENEPLAVTLVPDDAAFNRQSAPGQQRLVGLDAEFAEMAREIPGFGGMFYDEAGNLNVYVAGGQLRAAEARDERVIKTRVGHSMRARGRDVPADDRMIIREAAYDFTELAAQNGRMLPVLGVPGVVYTDIDESSNVLRVGITEETSEEQVRQALQMLGVSLEMVSIDIAEPILPLTDHTLRNRQQPLAGGLQLIMRHPQPGFVRLCSLGFNVLLPGARGRSAHHFFTNSHCTEVRGQVTGYEFFQQSIALPNPDYLIGIEVQDPPFFTDPCFTGFICRWSDAALVRYVTPSTPVKFGSIYRTEFFSTGNNAGSLIVDEENPKFFTIQDERPFPLLGEVLDKVGRTTGWTRGPVTQTCLHTTPGPPIAMLCQDRVQAMVGGGDSGSPVFQQVGESKDAVLYGILWGGSVQAGQQTFVFSALENIRLDFGDFRTH